MYSTWSAPCLSESAEEIARSFLASMPSREEMLRQGAGVWSIFELDCEDYEREWRYRGWLEEKRQEVLLTFGLVDAFVRMVGSLGDLRKAVELVRRLVPDKGISCLDLHLEEGEDGLVEEPYFSLMTGTELLLAKLRVYSNHHEGVDESEAEETGLSYAQGDKLFPTISAKSLFLKNLLDAYESGDPRL